MLLQEELDVLKANNMANIDSELKEKMLADAKRLKESDILNHSPKLGDKLKHFNLINHLGNNVDSATLFKNGPLVITFYRGGWCPYCNLELRAYQQILPQIKGLGATLVAISPELPDESLSTKQKHDLDFEVLTDIDATYIKEIGLGFSLSREIQEVYNIFGIDVEKHNGENQFDLPFAATFIVNQKGTITYAYVDTDYTLRANPTEIVEELKLL